MPSALNHWTEFKEQTVIKVLNARSVDAFKVEIAFSDRTQSVFDAGSDLATRSGPVYWQGSLICHGAECIYLPDMAEPAAKPG